MPDKTPKSTSAAPLPEEGQKQASAPAKKQSRRKLPLTGNPENTITIGGVMIEIKPTKLKYQRNRTATLYKLLDVYPLADILAMEEGVFGDDRDGDKAVYDWLVAVTDDEDLIREHYDSMDTDTIERLLTIFKSVNRIDEKESRQKKLQAAARDLPSTAPSL